MNRVVKIAITIVGIVLIGFVGRCVYMVLCISCTPGPLKTYNYSGSMDQLEDNFKRFAAHHQDINFEVSRRGTDSLDKINNISPELKAIAARDIIIKQKIDGKDIESHLVIYDFNGSTKLDVEEILDNTDKKGVDDANDSNVKKKLKKFEENFLTEFEKDQKIELE
jgi:hypothetical protein